MLIVAIGKYGLISVLVIVVVIFASRRDRCTKLPMSGMQTLVIKNLLPFVQCACPCDFICL